MIDPSLLLDGLNDKQREAVAAPLENLLILAGAGSGKTRVLVHRIAWLMSVEEASPFSVMAVTFTNKAAAEMRGRIEELMHGTASGMWCGTFHGICHRILRAHYLDAKLLEDFRSSTVTISSVCSNASSKRTIWMINSGRHAKSRGGSTIKR